LADAVQAHGEELALLDSLCMGMPITAALADVAEAAGALRQVVDAVNQVGATPSALIAILEALKSTGSLRAELIII
jgi:flagellar basal body P-ring protein FlgI